MPLRQIARTPRRPYLRITGIEDPYFGCSPYAFAVEIRQVRLDAVIQQIVMVRCPWCGEDHPTTSQDEDECAETQRFYTVAIPAGTPVLA